MELDGLVATDAMSLAPYIMHLIGDKASHLPASGLVAALALEDWVARSTAAEALRCVVIAFGPRIDLAQVHSYYSTAWVHLMACCGHTCLGNRLLLDGLLCVLYLATLTRVHLRSDVQVSDTLACRQRCR